MTDDQSDKPTRRPPSKLCGFRVSPRLLRRIDAARGEVKLSVWVREACTRRLESDAGLGPEFAAELKGLNVQLAALGSNLNQLARAANEGRPVVVERQLLDSIRDAINASTAIMSDVKRCIK
jgi:hypothetical protein